MSIVEAMYTAEEFAQLDSDGPLAELVRGKVVPLSWGTFQHGLVCSTVAMFLDKVARKDGLGRIAVNSGIITEHDPDTVRGADVAYYSFSRVPKGPLPAGYLPVVPELVLEVLSPDDRWPRVLRKIGEYLDAGVLVVCVLDPKHETAQVFRSEQPAETFSGKDKLEFPEALPGFRVRVKEFFE